MKTYQSIIISVMALVFTLPTMAQTVDKEAMYIYQNDGNASIFFRNEVTNMSIETRDGVMCQVVKTENKDYSYPVEAIQSISFVFPDEDNNKPDGFPEENAPTFGTAIDLGLPSGTKWASINVGASKPEEYGGYFAWGEVNEKDYYSPATYKYVVQTNHNASISHENDIRDSDTGIWYAGRSIGFYYDYEDYDHTSVYHIEGTEYDVAHMRWGDSWFMPTPDQVSELINNCTSERVTLKGVYGCMFTSIINGKSIFLPAAGRREYGAFKEGRTPYYWSTSIRMRYHGISAFWSPPYGTGSNEYRYYGLSVRPVDRIYNVNP